MHVALTGASPSIVPCTRAFKASFVMPGEGCKHMAVMEMPLASESLMDWLLAHQVGVLALRHRATCYVLYAGVRTV